MDDDTGLNAITEQPSGSLWGPVEDCISLLVTEHVGRRRDVVRRPYGNLLFVRFLSL